MNERTGRVRISSGGKAYSGRDSHSSFRLVSLAVPPNTGTRRLDERFDTGPRIRWPGFETSLLVPVLYFLIFASLYTWFHRICSSEREKRGPSIYRSVFIPLGPGRGPNRDRKPHHTHGLAYLYHQGPGERQPQR